MAMVMRVVPRSTPPHMPTLAGTLAPLLALANAGAFHLRYQNGAVLIEQNSFANVNTAAVDTAVANAPVHSAALDAKTDLDNWPKPLKALVRLIVVELNRLRQNPTAVFPAFTEAQVLTAIKNEIDGL
jgi:hypothetical protein